MNIFVDEKYEDSRKMFSFQMSSKTAEAGCLTEPESLGPCEPGTSINLDGIVWNETKGGESGSVSCSVKKLVLYCLIKQWERWVSE